MLQCKFSGGACEITSVITEQFLVHKPLLYRTILSALAVLFANSLGGANEDSLIRRDSHLQRWSSGQG